MSTNYQNDHFTIGDKWATSTISYNTTYTGRAVLTYPATGSTVRFDQTYGIKPLDTAGQLAAQQVFQELTKHINLTATSVSNTTPSITISYAQNIESFDSATNTWNSNSGIARRKVANGNITQVDILIDPDNSLKKGDFGFETMLHEVGHALRLYTSGAADHPHEIGSLGSNYSPDNTIMAYYEETKSVTFTAGKVGFNSTPAMYDIAALQHLYGAKTASTSGANTYSFETGQVKTIWDAGGQDTLDASSMSNATSVTLDLRGGADDNNRVHFSQLGAGRLEPEAGKNYGELYGRTAAVAIGYQDLQSATNEDPVRIEEARGGAGDDVLIAYDNVAADAVGSVLKGNGGKDTLFGGAGVNTLEGGADTDFFYADENDKVDAGDGEDVIAIYKGFADKDNNVIVGGSGTAQVSGGAGVDHFGVFGKTTIKDIAREDKVYVNNIQVTGGVKEAAFDAPVAWNLLRGHAFQVWNGDINQENGATLVAKYLWDNDAVAFIENYTRPFLGKGDASIEIYQITAGIPNPLREISIAYNDMFHNGSENEGVAVGNTPSTGGSSGASGNTGNITPSAPAATAMWLKGQGALLNFSQDNFTLPHSANTNLQLSHTPSTLCCAAM